MGEENENEQKDKLTEIIGDMGRYQFLLMVLLGFSIVTHAWQMLANKFLTLPVKFACAPTFMNETQPDFLMTNNLTMDRWINISSPGGDACTTLTFDSLDDALSGKSTGEQQCTGFIYDTKTYQNSALMNFNLVCEGQFYTRVAQFIFFAGSFAGMMITGYLADYYGRLMAFKIWMTLWILSTVIEAYVTNFWVWTALRFVAGGSSIAFNTCQTVYLVEFVGFKWRSTTNHIFRALPFQIGFATLPLLVYLIPDMQNLELFIGLSGLPFFIMSFFFHESPRWLFVKGRIEEAKKVVRSFCKHNKRPCNEDQLDELAEWFRAQSKGEAGHILELRHYKCCLRNLVLIGICWMSLSMTYYGLAYNTPAFGLDERIVFGIPVWIFIWTPIAFVYIENGYGRKKFLLGSLLSSTVFLFLTLAVPRGVYAYNWPIIALCYLGLVSSTAAFGAAYSYTRELFPTSIRSTCLSYGSAKARIGSMLSSVVASADVVDPILPILIYGGVSLIAGVMGLWIYPETNEMKLPETLEECEKVSKRPKKKYCF